mgnify:FL=1
MKNVEKIAAQGELTIKRIGDVSNGAAPPDGYVNLSQEDGRLIIGHSETGHVHFMDNGGVSVAVLDRPSEAMRILHLIVSEPKELKHMRSFDTHESLLIPPGVYEVRTAREYDPLAKIARRVAD